MGYVETFEQSLNEKSEIDIAAVLDVKINLNKEKAWKYKFLKMVVTSQRKFLSKKSKPKTQEWDVIFVVGKESSSSNNRNHVLNPISSSLTTTNMVSTYMSVIHQEIKIGAPCADCKEVSTRKNFC